MSIVCNDEKQKKISTQCGKLLRRSKKIERAKIVSWVPLDTHRKKNYFAIQVLHWRERAEKYLNVTKKCPRFNELTYESGDHFIVALAAMNFCTLFHYPCPMISSSHAISFAAAPRDIITLKLLSIGIKSFLHVLLGMPAGNSRKVF